MGLPWMHCRGVWAWDCGIRVWLVLLAFSAVVNYVFIKVDAEVDDVSSAIKTNVAARTMSKYCWGGEPKWLRSFGIDFAVICQVSLIPFPFAYSTCKTLNVMAIAMSLHVCTLRSYAP